jgi:hypothetical protein
LGWVIAELDADGGDGEAGGEGEGGAPGELDDLGFGAGEEGLGGGEAVLLAGFGEVLVEFAGFGGGEMAAGVGVDQVVFVVAEFVHEGGVGEEAGGEVVLFRGEEFAEEVAAEEFLSGEMLAHSELDRHSLGSEAGMGSITLRF